MNIRYKGGRCMKRVYYLSSVNEFIVKDIFIIFGEIMCND